MWPRLFLLVVLVSPSWAEEAAIPICKVFENLPAFKNQRIAVRGIRAKTEEGLWLHGNCELPEIANGPAVFPQIVVELPDTYTKENPGKLPTLSPVPRNAAQFRGLHMVRTLETWVGRLIVDESYHYQCRPDGEYFPVGGYGHLNGSGVKLILEEIRDVEMERLPPDVQPRDRKPCFSPQVAQLCATRANTLHVAAAWGCADRVAEFLRKGGIDTKNGSPSKALTLAIQRGDMPIVKMLLAAGAPVNPAGAGDDTPLRVSMGGYPNPKSSITKLLLQLGANVDAPGRDGSTALVNGGFYELPTLRLLLGAGATVDATGSSGRTALMWASAFGLEYSVALLLDHGAEPNRRDSDGRTALMHAALGSPMGRFVDAIPLLLKAGADPAIRDNQGKSALDLALKSKNEVAVEMLSAIERR